MHHVFFAAQNSTVESDTTMTQQPGSSRFDKITYPEILTPQFYGTNQVLRWELEPLLAGIDTQRLFKSHFGGGNLKEKDFAVAVTDTFLPAFEQLKKDILAKQLCDAAGLYGIFPVFTHDTSLVLLSPGDFHSQLAEFNMPRQPRAGNRSLADFINPDGDVVGVQVVTLGGAIDREIVRLGATDKYSQGFFLNAIANYLTEQLAHKASTEIRRACYLATDRGRRYSFGYPGLPGVEEQTKLFEIMSVEERLGITFTPGFQMVPEHSTMGIFVHHPQAEYF